MLWYSYVHYTIFNPKFIRQNLTSESDLYRRQILTSKGVPRAERVKCTTPTLRIHGDVIGPS